jgi:hypothetical protein
VSIRFVIIALVIDDLVFSFVHIEHDVKFVQTGGLGFQFVLQRERFIDLLLGIGQLGAALTRPPCDE